MGKVIVTIKLTNLFDLAFQKRGAPNRLGKAPLALLDFVVTAKARSSSPTPPTAASR